jgi:hypothetical protein
VDERRIIIIINNIIIMITFIFTVNINIKVVIVRADESASARTREPKKTLALFETLIFLKSNSLVLSASPTRRT